MTKNRVLIGGISLISLTSALIFIYIIKQGFFSQNQDNGAHTPITKNQIALPSPTFTPPSLDKILSYSTPSSQLNRCDTCITIVATGDVIPARSVNWIMENKNDFTLPFSHTSSLLKKGDITIVNLESPLIPSCPSTNEGMVFCGNQRFIEGLRFAGIDVASFANNHMGNYGEEGITATKKLLEQNNIEVSGVSNSAPPIITVRNKKVGFLSYTQIYPQEKTLNWVKEEKMKSDIAQLKPQTDLVVVSIHWGEEYTTTPTDKQKDLAHLLIDSGADIILGNHPHWVQKVELYNNKLIVYAHGNFIFDQMWSEETREGVIGRYEFNANNSLVSAQFTPVIIENYSTPRLANKKESERILNRMKEERN